MAAPTRAIANAGATITDVNQLIDLLEGVTYDEAFLLKSSTGQDFIIRLADAAGARKFIIQSSTGATIASIDSLGALIATSATWTTFYLPYNATPTETTAGQMVFDSTKGIITYGDGTNTRRLSTGDQWTSLAEATTSTATGDNVLMTITPSYTIPANQYIFVYGQYRRSSGFAAACALGIKLNATQVYTATDLTKALAYTTAVSQAEDGFFAVVFYNRTTNYATAGYQSFKTHVSATGVIAQADVDTNYNAVPPTGGITSIVITGNSGNAGNTLGVANVYVITYPNL